MILKKFNVEVKCEDTTEIQRYKELGYVPIAGSDKVVSSITKGINAVAQEVTDSAKQRTDLTSRTKTELADLAKAKGIEGAKNLKKEELIEVLEAEEA